MFGSLSFQSLVNKLNLALIILKYSWSISSSLSFFNSLPSCSFLLNCSSTFSDSYCNNRAFYFLFSSFLVKILFQAWSVLWGDYSEVECDK